MKAGFGKVVFVIRESIEKEFKEYFINRLPKSIKLKYVLQEIDKLPEGLVFPEGRIKPWGTAHAVLMAAEVIKEPFVVINAEDFFEKNEVFEQLRLAMRIASTDSNKGLNDEGEVHSRKTIEKKQLISEIG